MKIQNIKAEFELIIKLIGSVNSKEEFVYLQNRMNEISSFYLYNTAKATERSVI